MSSQFARQSFLGEDSVSTLASTTAGCVGLGGGGAHVVQQLAHLGVGRYVLFDDDVIDETNLNRLVGGTLRDVRQSTRKTDISVRQIRRVLRGAQIEVVNTKWQLQPDALRDCDVVVGCLDNMASRVELEAYCRRYLIPYIDIGMDVFAVAGGFSISGQAALSMPGNACLRCMGVVRDEWIDAEAARYGAAGGKPQVVWPNGVLASLAVGMLVQCVTPWHCSSPSLLLEFDGNTQEVSIGTLAALAPRPCLHYGSIDSLGDPWFTLDAINREL